jgi:hypothetical protein
MRADGFLGAKGLVSGALGPAARGSTGQSGAPRLAIPNSFLKFFKTVFDSNL